MGTQHVIEERDLEAAIDATEDALPVPPAWRKTSTGEPMPNVVAAVRRSRAGH